MSDKNFKVKNGLDANGAVTITQPDTSTTPLTISANTLATGSDLFQIKRPDGTVRFAVGNDGALTVNSNINFNGGNMTMYPANSGQTPLIINSQTNQTAATLVIKMATGQTSNLTEWQDAAGSVAARISSDYRLAAIGGGFFGTATGSIVGQNYLAVKPWAANHIPFVVQGYASQTGDLTRWVDSSANTLAKVDASGNITAPSVSLTIPSSGTTPAIFAKGESSYATNIAEFKDALNNLQTRITGYGALVTQNFGVGPNASSFVGFSSTTATIKSTGVGNVALALSPYGSTSTADIFQIWKWDGSEIFVKVDPSGVLTAKDLVLSGNLTVNGTTTNLNSTNLVIEDKNIILADVATPTDTTADGGGITLKGATDKTIVWSNTSKMWESSDGFKFTSPSVSVVPLMVQVATDGLAQDTFQIKTGSNTRFSIDGYGMVNASVITISNGAANTNVPLSIFNTLGTTLAFKIKGASSQTANLTEWQNSSGTVVASMRGDGLFNSYWGYHTYLQPQTGTGPYINLTSTGMSIVNYTTASNNVLTVKGMASQTGDLQQWQDSAGTVLARVYSNGAINAGTYNGVTIGLNYPGIVLDTSSGANTQIWLRNLSASTASGRFVGIKARNAYADAVAGDDLVTLAGQQYISGTAYESGKILISNDDSTPSTTSYPARITFHTTSIGSTTLTERMRISSSGNVLINGFGSSTSGLTIKGAASQTASLQQWQNSTGTSVAYMEIGRAHV